MGVAAGKLDTYITFQSKVIPETKDSFGNAQENWSDAFQAWAALERPGSREFPTFLKRYSESTARFIVRFDRRLLVANAADKFRILQVLDNCTPVISQTWNISQPYPDDKNTSLIIEASEVH